MELEFNYGDESLNSWEAEKRFRQGRPEDPVDRQNWDIMASQRQHAIERGVYLPGRRDRQAAQAAQAAQEAEAPKVKPGTVLPAEAKALAEIPAPEGSPAGFPPLQVGEIGADENCVRCRERKKDLPRYVGTCGHSMHDKCYEQLPRQMGKRICPFCKKTQYGGRKSRRLRHKHKKLRKTRRH